MRSLISIDFPDPEIEPENAHVVSAVSVPQLYGTTRATFTNPSLLRATLLRGMLLLQLITEEARTCEAWFQLTFRPQKWNLKAHMWFQLSPFPSSNAAIAMQHHPCNIHQSVATPRYSATPWYVSIQLPNVIDTISKRWRSKKAFNNSPSHIFP